MSILSAPSKKLDRRILSEVEYEDRIIGYRLGQRIGLTPVTLYSFEEIICFLSNPIPMIDFNALESWIRTIMEDNELADKIKEVRIDNASDHDKTFYIKDLMAERLRQCKRCFLLL
jgi:hypothetical protein